MDDVLHIADLRREWELDTEQSCLNLTELDAPRTSHGPAGTNKKVPDQIGAFEIHGAQGRNRTVDTRIFSPLLYRLSYLGILRCCMFCSGAKNQYGLVETRIFSHWLWNGSGDCSGRR